MRRTTSRACLNVRVRVRAGPTGRGDPAPTGGPAALPGAVSFHPRQPVRHVDFAARPRPDFARAVSGWALNAPAFPFLGFDRAWRPSTETHIADLRQAQRPAYEAEITRYRDLVTPAVAEVFAYLKITQPPTEGVVVLPNLLHAYWRGYGPRVGDLSYVVMGPAVEPNVGLIQHEAMHPILNPLVDAHLGAVELGPADRLYGRAQAAPRRRISHRPNMLHESVIRAVEVRLAAPADRERLIRQEEAAGFPLVRPLAGRLADYEASGQALAEFMPRLLAVLNDETLLR